MRAWLQHHFNELHIFCLLRKLRIPDPSARQAAQMWGIIVGRLLYG